MPSEDELQPNPEDVARASEWLPELVESHTRQFWEATAALVHGCSANNLKLGLATLSADTATALAKYANNSPFLRSLTTLSDEAAVALGTSRCKNLSLNSVTKLSPEAKVGLAAYQGDWSARQ